MTDSSVRRVVGPRLWRGLALAGAAAGLAAAQPALAEVSFGSGGGAVPERIWLAQAEGGEGGESGAVAEASPEAGYLARLLIVEGHLLAAVTLYGQGQVDDAVGLSGHPEAEMMDEVREALATHGAADFSDAMARLTEVMAAGAPLAEVQAALAEVRGGIAAAAEGAQAKARFGALVALLRAAGVEYQGSIEGGTVADLITWNEALGFVQAGQPVAAALAADADPVVAKAGAKAVAALAEAAALFGDGAAPVAGDPAVLAGAAASIELAAYPVK